MPLFGKKRGDAPAAPIQEPLQKLASGLRLTSTHALDAVLSDLDRAVRSYLEPKYRHMPLITQPGVRWLASSKPPTQVVAFDGDDGYLLVVGLWEREEGVEAGLFPLGQGDARLRDESFTARWQATDTSLRTVGIFPPGQLGLIAPQLSNSYFTDMLRAAGRATNSSNELKLRSKLRELFSIKAWEYINSQNPRLAQRFVEEHQRASPQEVLDELAAWNREVIPYIQQIPYRIHGLLLENTDTDSFWDDYAK